MICFDCEMMLKKHFKIFFVKFTGFSFFKFHVFNFSHLEKFFSNFIDSKGFLDLKMFPICSKKWQELFGIRFQTQKTLFSVKMKLLPLKLAHKSLWNRRINVASQYYLNRWINELDS